MGPDDTDVIKSILVGTAVCAGTIVPMGAILWIVGRGADEFTDARREAEHARWRKKWGINAPGVPIPGKERE